MSELVLLRHAPTAWNRDRRLQGRTDVALDEEAVAIAQRWQIVPAWRERLLLVSPLLRARATASILFPDNRQMIDDRLIEMSFGEWEGKRLADLRNQQGADASERERLGLDFKAPGGESPREVQARLHPLLGQLGLAQKPAVAVTHKAVIRALYALATGWDMREKPAHRLKDGCAQVLELDSQGRIAVRQLNYRLDREQ